MNRNTDQFRSNKRRNPATYLVAALAAAALFAGCGSKDPARVPVFPVTGKVKFGAQVPVGAQVVLHPVGGTSAEGVSATGRVKPDGTFAVTSYAEGDGAPAGEYVVTVQWFKIVAEDGGGGSAGPNVIPHKFSNPTTSPIKVSVAGGPTQLPDIVIPRS